GPLASAVPPALPREFPLSLHVLHSPGISRRLGRPCLLPPAQHLRIHDRGEDGRNPSARSWLADLRPEMLGLQAGQDRRARPRVKVLRVAAVAIAVAVTAYALLVIAAKPLLSLPTQVEQADIIVVLGGDAPLRASAAA